MRRLRVLVSLQGTDATKRRRRYRVFVVALEMDAHAGDEMKHTRTKDIVCFTTPIGKPRMTRRDKWSQRPCVLRYRAFADELRKATGKLPEDVHGLFWSAYLPIPKSWSKKKKAEMALAPHRQTPDKDNIEKAIMDSLFKDDSGIYFGSGEKYWAGPDGPKVCVTITYTEEGGEG